MVSLKQVSSTTVTSPWSGYTAGLYSFYSNQIVNPFYPVFIFNYTDANQADCSVIGYVIGDKAGNFFGGACASLIRFPMFDFTIFGYPYVMGGIAPPISPPYSCCVNTGWFFANLQTNSLDAYCCGFMPCNSVSGYIYQILADLVEQNIFIITSPSFLMWIIPVSEISTLLQNATPLSMKFAYITNEVISNNSSTEIPSIIYDGNLIIASEWSYNLYTGVISLSQIYSIMMSGVPNSNMSPVNIGTVYQLGEYQKLSRFTMTSIAVPAINNITIYISFCIATSSGTCYIQNVSPSNWSTVSSFQVDITSIVPITNISITPLFWNNVFLIGESGFCTGSSNFYIIVIDPKTGNYEYTLVPNTQYSSKMVLSFSGYVAVSQQNIADSTVTFDVYQILLDHTYVFQNISISTSSSTITVSGTLYDDTENASVSGATVWLTAVRSIEGQYTNDVIPVVSSTTDSNGQFTISVPIQAGYQYYGVLYIP